MNTFQSNGFTWKVACVWNTNKTSKQWEVSSASDKWVGWRPVWKCNVFDRTRQFLTLNWNIIYNVFICKLCKLTSTLQFVKRNTINVRLKVELKLLTNVKTEIPIIVNGYCLNPYFNLLLNVLIRWRLKTFSSNFELFTGRRKGGPFASNNIWKPNGSTGTNCHEIMELCSLLTECMAMFPLFLTLT
jgi:hypothetical protein